MRPDRLIRSGQPLDFPEGLLCGVDEAGRGPIAGPVTAAAVILHPDCPIPGLADSKKLSAVARDALEGLIKARALAWSTACASVAEIDALNILQATLLAMRRAVEALTALPAVVAVDGLYSPRLSASTVAVVKGDARVAAISAASILAKTERDRLMAALGREYPQYQFERHKGYPTALHLERLRAHGASPHHRLSFAPVSATRCA